MGLPTNNPLPTTNSFNESMWGTEINAPVHFQ